MQDALSALLALIEINSLRATRLEAAGRWSWRFPAKPLLKFVALLRGDCWIVLEGAEPCALREGDIFLLADAPAHVVTNDLARRPLDGLRAFDWERSDIARYQGDDTVLLGGGFEFGGTGASLLLGSLPRFLHLPADDPAAPVLQGTLRLLDEELRGQGIGRSLLSRRLAEILLVQALRALPAAGEPRRGLLAGLADPQIARSLELMHGAPARRWTVAGLAAEAGLSRSGFAARFKETVGVPPLEYLLSWRMERAREALRRDDVRLGRLAEELGYASESAFSTAFRRAFGCAPRRYWRSAQSR